MRYALGLLVVGQRTLQLVQLISTGDINVASTICRTTVTLGHMRCLMLPLACNALN